LAVSLAKVNYTQAIEKYKDPYNPISPEVQDAIKYFQMAADWKPDTVEAWKGLGFLYSKIGKPAESQAALRKALELSPNDQELKASVR